MAKARKSAQADLPAQRDPAAPLDAAAFLRAAQPVLRRLTDDLLVRADASPHVTAALKRQHTTARAQHRTAEEFVVWRRSVMTQVAAAWLLSCVFIRVLEDRGLIHARLAGPAASDSERTFFQFAPSLTHREYLLMVFRELTRLPAAADLFDSKHNLVWRLAPSDEACKGLLQLFRFPSIEAPAFRFGQLDTRFLGDLYQELDAEVREHYALFQTPDFVEAFILDQTLEPAIREYGIERADLLDPTCGSGHFLLGAFPRYVDHLRRIYPTKDDRELARDALDKIYGVDLNPYAVSIARFRLFIKFLEVGGFWTLKNVPRIKINVVAADSLLYGFAGQQGDLSERQDQNPNAWFGKGFSVEDPEAARHILAERKYACVVGNPPYTTVEDPQRRATYRSLYPRSAYKEYSLSAPFLERFFLLARTGGFTGQITTSSFTKREYGKRAIESFLPSVSLHLVVNADGCYIPNHGTPTVMLFGRNSPPQPDAMVRVVLSKRGENGIPADPATAVVWRTVVEQWNNPGFENEYRSVEDMPLSRLHKHAWSLEGGGKTDLKVYLESRTKLRLAQMVESVGFMCITKQDDAFGQPTEVLARHQIEADHLRPFQAGETVRDWVVVDDESVIFPYTPEIALASPASLPRALKFLWPAQAILFTRKVFGGADYLASGKSWFEYGQIPADRFKQPLSIAFSEVATHNHFALDRGGRVFKQTAPLIKLHAVEDKIVDEENNLLLLAYLNSSTACFWLKQVAYPKGMHNGSKANSTPFLVRFAYDGSKVKKLPVPSGLQSSAHRQKLVALARQTDSIQTERNNLTFARILASLGAIITATKLESCFAETLTRRVELQNRAIALQEEIDWYIYYLFDLIDVRLANVGTDYSIAPGERPFEIRLAQDQPESVISGWFKWSQVPPSTQVPPRLTEPVRRVLQERLQIGRESSQLRILESPENKRRWRQPSGKAAQSLETDEKVLRDQARQWLSSRLEEHVRSQPEAVSSRRELVTRISGDAALIAVLGWLDPSVSILHFVSQGLSEAAVPYLAPLRMDRTGFEKFTGWKKAQAMQRIVDDFEANKATIRSFLPTLNKRMSYDEATSALEKYEQHIHARMEYWGTSSHPDLATVRRLRTGTDNRNPTTSQQGLFADPESADRAHAEILELFNTSSVKVRASRYRATIPRPAEFEPSDFREDIYRLRGSLDLPQERFISYPDCTSDVDQEPVYGWAGWDHLQRSLALFQLYYARKDEAWSPARLGPMLAGLEELLPWVRQWHAEARSPETGQLYHEYFDQVIASEAAELGFSRAQLATWAPPERGTGRKSAKAAAPKVEAVEVDPDAPAPDGEPAVPAKRKPGRKPKTAPDSTDAAPARKRKSKSAAKPPPASE